MCSMIDAVVGGGGMMVCLALVVIFVGGNDGNVCIVQPSTTMNNKDIVYIHNLVFRHMIILMIVYTIDRPRYS